MRYNLHLPWIILICAVIGMLALDMPMAEAADEEVLTLELPSIVTDPVPGTEVDVPVTVVDGYTDADLVDAISIAIEYDSSVATPKNTTIGDGIMVDFETFGITGWTVIANITPGQLPNAEQVRIVMMNPMPGIFPPLSEPIGGFPADLLTIKFVVQTFYDTDSTELLFVDDTYFAKRNFDKLLLDEDTVNGSISFQPTGSTEVTLSLPSIVTDPMPGIEVDVPLTVEGGYMDEDLIDAIKITIAYDSTVVDIAHDPPQLGTDIQIYLDRFGITGGWQASAVIKTDLVPPEHPELDKQLQISMWNGNPTSVPALGEPESFPEDLLTIKFIVQSDNPQDKTLLFFVNELHSYFGKRDLTKLPVDPIHGSISFTEAQGSINGTVTDRAGNPIKFVLVIAVLGETREKDFTDSQGYYEISDLEPGTYWVLCIKRGYKVGIRKAEVATGEETTVNFRLRRRLD